MCTTDPARLTTAAMTGGASEAALAAQRLPARKRQKDQQGAKVIRKQNQQRRSNKITGLREEQIKKFNTNVTAGGAKRAANI